MEAILWFLSFVGALMLLMAFRVPVAVSMGLIGIAGTAAFVIQATARLVVMNTAGWAAFVAALPGYGWP